MVIDSDLRSEESALSDTKRRIANEYNRETEAPGFASLTDFCSPENYLPRKKLTAAVALVQPGRAPFDRIAIARQVVADLAEDAWDCMTYVVASSVWLKFVGAANRVEGDGSTQLWNRRAEFDPTTSSGWSILFRKAAVHGPAVHSPPS